jgi:hypothetical protein
MFVCIRSHETAFNIEGHLTLCVSRDKVSDELMTNEVSSTVANEVTDWCNGWKNLCPTDDAYQHT